MIWLDGLGLLHQWDIGRKLQILDVECDQVHFANSTAVGSAFVVVAETDGEGNVFAEIPNCLLMSGESIDIWVVHNGVVVDSRRLPVLDRPKPDDYIYTPTEVLSLTSMRDWVEKRIGELGIDPSDYENLENLPQIEGTVLIGNKTFKELGITLATDEDIDQMFEEAFHG